MTKKYDSLTNWNGDSHGGQGYDDEENLHLEQLWCNCFVFVLICLVISRAPYAVTGAARLSECRDTEPVCTKCWDATIISEEGTPGHNCERCYDSEL